MQLSGELNTSWSDETVPNREGGHGSLVPASPWMVAPTWGGTWETLCRASTSLTNFAINTGHLLWVGEVGRPSWAPSRNALLGCTRGWSRGGWGGEERGMFSPLCY